MNAFLSMLFMAWHYLLGRKLRTTLTTLAIVFGVAMIFSINLVMPSAMAAFQQSLETENAAVDLSMVNQTGEAFEPTPLTEQLLGIDGVTAVSGVLRRRVILPLDNNPLGDIKEIELIGIDLATYAEVRAYDLSAGAMLQADGQAVVSAEVGQVGEDFTLTTANGLKTYTIRGILKNESARPQILVTLADAQTALNVAGGVNLIEVAFSEGVNETQVTNQIKAALGDQYLYNATSEGELASAELGYLTLNLFGMIALFLGSFLIFNTFRTVVVERRHDLAMLRVLGATRRQLTQLILIESLLQGVIGTVLGLFAGYFLTLGLASMMNQLYSQLVAGIRIELTVEPKAFILAIGLGLGSTLVAGYLPARNAGKTSPLEALRPLSSSDLQKANRWSLIAGGAIMLISVGLLLSSEKGATFGAILFLLGGVIASPGLVIPVARLFQPLLTLWFAREGDLARNNLIRQPGRAAITASTLMIGLATFIMVAALVSGFDLMMDDLVESSFGNDVVLMPAGLGTYNRVMGADEGLGEALRALREVETVSEVRYASSGTDNLRLEVFGIDPLTHPQVAPLIFVEGDSATAYAELSQGRTMVMNSLLASTLGLKVGDDFSLPTLEGEQTYRLVGIGNDLMNIKLNALFISHANLQTDFHKTESILIMMNLRPEADEQAAFAKIQAITQAYPQFNLQLTQDYRHELSQLMTGALKAFYVIALIILIPAAMGLLNTLTINIMERTREIGIIRAVGGSRKQVQRMVVAEALLLGLFGAAIGVVVGVAMSYGFTVAFAMIGWKMPYIFPVMGIIAAVIIAVLLGLFSSILPARNAAKLDIIRALQYE